MNASVPDLSVWFDRGVRQGSAFMIVVCDTYDFSCYPTYSPSIREARKVVNGLGGMERAEEVYDLSADKLPQMRARRTWRLPPKGETP